MQIQVWARITETCSLCKGTGRYYNHVWLEFSQKLTAWEQQNSQATAAQKEQFENDYWKAEGYDGRPWESVACPTNCQGRVVVSEKWIDAQSIRG